MRRSQTAQSVLAETIAITGLLLPVLIAFRGTITSGLIAYEDDTRVFYYPVFAYAAARLKAGELPLWVPELFSGFPIFADGEAGVLYPLHLLAMLLLPAETAFLWLQPLRFVLGALFMYLFCRVIGTGRVGAIVGGIAFSLSGFAVAQIHHTNISTGMVWLPLLLTLSELGLRRAGPRRYLCFVFTGVAWAMPALTMHIQVVIMSAAAVVAFVLYRCLVGASLASPPSPLSVLPPGRMERGSPSAGRTGVRRLALAGVAIGLPAAIGMGLAAVQLLPLAELAQFSTRGAGVTYDFASQYSLHPLQLIALLFPDFFVADGRYWGPWARWEFHPYVGMAPLVLATVAVVLAHNRYTVFFLGLALVGISIAFGEYSPFGLHQWLVQWPGFDLLRAPGRFVYLFSFGIAVLAAQGTGYLVRTLRWQQPGIVPTLGQQLNATLLTVVLVLWQLGAMAIPLALSAASAFVAVDKETTIRLLERWHLPLNGLDPRHTVEYIYLYLRAALDLTQPSTIRQVVLLLMVVSLLLLWEKLRLLARFWQVALVVVLAADLLAHATTFHPVAPLGEMMAPSGAERFLADQTGLYRAYTWNSSREEPNRLLRLGLADANGYSSLQPVRHEVYAASATYTDNRLFDVWNVRYLVQPNRFQPLPDFELTSFNPNRPLASSTGRSAAATVRFRVGGVVADRVRLISTLRWAMSIPQGTTVARLTVADTSGQRQMFAIRAGVHTAEWAWDRPDLRGNVLHQKPRTAYTWQQAEGNGSFPAHLYYAEFGLGQPRPIRELEVQFVHPTVQAQVYGLSLRDSQAERSDQISPQANAKYRQVYRDPEVVIYENLTVLPRAYLVPAAVVVPPGEGAVQRMARGAFQPGEVVFVEDMQGALAQPRAADSPSLLPPEGWRGGRGGKATLSVRATQDGWGSASAAGTATISVYQPGRVVIEVKASQPAMLFLGDTHYPGWSARIDGRETPIYRANYLFRAVAIPAGTHTVEFTYAPRSFRIGAMISLLTGLAVLAALGVLIRAVSRR